MVHNSNNGLGPYIVELFSQGCKFSGNTNKKSVSCRPGGNYYSHPVGRIFYFFSTIFFKSKNFAYSRGRRGDYKQPPRRLLLAVVIAPIYMCFVYFFFFFGGGGVRPGGAVNQRF